MDFAAPEAVTRALLARAAHPIYGYTLYPDSLFEALIAWMKKRHGWEIQREWILMSPGVVPSLHAAALAFTQPGEGVIIQPPVYFPFASSVTNTGRRLVVNPLRLENGRYEIDFDHLEQCAAQGARLLLLCSPHNPVSRVWSREELEEILRIARRHDLIVLSDEIHADLVYPDFHHTPLAALADNGEQYHHGRGAEQNLQHSRTRTFRADRAESRTPCGHSQGLRPAACERGQPLQHRRF